MNRARWSSATAAPAAICPNTPSKLRNETRYLAGTYAESPAHEYLQFYCMGIDGLFSDFPDTAATARELLQFENACLSSSH